jgi:hypothetical protein
LRPKREDAANENIPFYRQLVLFVEIFGVFFVDSVERVIVFDAARTISTAPNASSGPLYFGLSSIVGLCTKAVYGEAILAGIVVERGRVEQAASNTINYGTNVAYVADATYMQGAYGKSLSELVGSTRIARRVELHAPNVCFTRILRVMH